MKFTVLLAVTLAAFASAAAVAQPEPEISELERRLIIGMVIPLDHLHSRLWSILTVIPQVLRFAVKTAIAPTTSAAPSMDVVLDLEDPPKTITYRVPSAGESRRSHFNWRRLNLDLVFEPIISFAFPILYCLGLKGSTIKFRIASMEPPVTAHFDIASEMIA